VILGGAKEGTGARETSGVETRSPEQKKKLQEEKERFLGECQTGGKRIAETEKKGNGMELKKQTATESISWKLLQGQTQNGQKRGRKRKGGEEGRTQSQECRRKGSRQKKFPEKRQSSMKLAERRNLQSEGDLTHRLISEKRGRKKTWSKRAKQRVKKKEKLEEQAGK